MRNKQKWKLTPHAKTTIVRHPELSAHELRAGIADAEGGIVAQSVSFWACVQHVDSPAGREREAEKLTAAGWVAEPRGWFKDGVPLLSEAGFHIDRESHTTHELNCCLRELARMADGLTGAALPAMWAAFVAGGKNTELTAYKNKTRGVGRKSTAENVGAAILAAWQQWRRAQKKPRGDPLAKELFEHYNTICSKFNAPPFENMRTFENRVAEWKKGRRLGG